MLSRYDDQGNRLEKVVYENHGIGTSIAITVNGNYVLGAVDTNNHATLLCIDSSDISNILWTYTSVNSDIEENWMRVYTHVTRNNEILMGYCDEEIWSESVSYTGWYHGSYVEVIDIQGALTSIYNIGTASYGHPTVICGIDAGRSVGATTPVTILAHGIGYTQEHVIEVTNGGTSYSDLCLYESRAYPSVTPYGPSDDAIFNCERFSSVATIHYGYGNSNTLDNQVPYWQKFDISFGDGTLVQERVYSGSETIIRGPEFHLGDGQSVGISQHAIGMTRGSSSSSDFFVEYWKLETTNPVLSLSRQNTSISFTVTGHASSTPTVSFTPAGSYQVDVFDLSGRTVTSFQGSSDQPVTRVLNADGELASGNYLVRIVSGGEAESAKVLIIQ